MRSFLFFFSLCSCLIQFSCGPSKSTDNSTEATDGKVITAAYVSATYYTGKTDYVFIQSDGEMIEFSDDNFEETKIEKSVSMLEEDTGDTPGANPIFIGKDFNLYYNSDDELVKIELVPGQKIYSKAIVAVYTSAAEYLDHKTYEFTPYFSEEPITFSIMDEEEKPTIDLPDNLMTMDESGEQTMLSPNLVYVGLEFVLSYDENNQLAKVELIKGQTVPSKVVMATYLSAAVSAGKIEYQFSVNEGEPFIISDGIDDQAKIEKPYNLLESKEGLEGPQGANPELVDYLFKIYYNADNEVYRIVQIYNE
ncbi:MAG: hypothetical protein R2828_03755 [Saprospiraceae bacterium]